MSSNSTFQCSPALHRKAGETCLPTPSLEKLTRIWNKKYPRNKINLGNATRKTKKDDQSAGNTRNAKIWRQLRNAMKQRYKCETEYCLVKKLPGIDESEKQSMMKFFRPEKPAEWKKTPRLWLDSYNIEDVLAQYEDADTKFEFIGPVPIDFDSKIGSFGKCIVDELCKLDLEKVHAEGTKKIGIVFNLDKHNEPGSHWVCAFLDLVKKEAYYFDSYGFEPPTEILEFLQKCKSSPYCERVFYNDIRHQRKGSECGMYCLFVLICLIHDKPFYDICKNILDDDMVASFRDVLYATENPKRKTIDDAFHWFKQF